MSRNPYSFIWLALIFLIMGVQIATATVEPATQKWKSETITRQSAYTRDAAAARQPITTPTAGNNGRKPSRQKRLRNSAASSKFSTDREAAWNVVGLGAAFARL